MFAVLATAAGHIPAQGVGSDSAVAEESDGGLAGAGHLRPFGAWLSPREGQTVSVLPDGAVLVFGYGPVVDARYGQAAQSLSLRRRVERANPSGPFTEPAVWDPARRGWRKLPQAPECGSAVRYLHTATVLPDSKVLIAGGLCDMPKMGDDREPHKAYTALSLWDQTTRAWLPAPALRQQRIFHTATPMPDGSVLIAGGESDPGLISAPGEPVLDSVERFAAGEVTSLPPLGVARARHTATSLGDGSVLVAGGFDESGRAIASVERWDPGARVWQTLPSARVARYGHTATRLEDGRVMIAGGLGRDGRLLSSVEIWDPARQTWSDGPALPIPLLGHDAALLTSGKVLVAGGSWIGSYGDPVPWAWTWDAASNEWLVAGHTAPARDTELSDQITLVPQADGGALVFTVPYIMRWEPFPQFAAGKAPLWQSRPSLAALGDGRVMLVGRLAGDSGGRRPVARIWNPRDDSWTDAGSPGNRVWMHTAAIALPSGRVIYVGLDSDRKLNCEAWEAVGNGWQECGSIALEYVSHWQLEPGLLPDGRAFVVANKHEVLVFDEAQDTWRSWRVEWNTEGLAYGAPIRGERPLARILDEASGQWLEINDAGARFWQIIAGSDNPNMLWDGKAGAWAYIFPERKMGRDARFLPDGCAISTNPVAVFDPVNARARPLVDPGLGMSPGESAMLVLADGTVVVAGVAAGARDPGAGFFHRKATCDGFARQVADEGYIAGGVAVHNPVGVSEGRAATPRTTDGRSQWWEDILRVAQDRKWLLLAIVGPVLGYLVLRRAGIRRVQMGPAWALRMLVYGLFLIYVVPPIWSYVRFDRVMGEQACAEDPGACLNPDSGLLKDGRSGQTDEVASTIPCPMVGVWSSRHGGLMYRIELKDDGTYAMEPNVAGVGSRSGYTGHWAVQGNNMVWRHDQGGSDLDVNPILPESDTRFTLIERNGSRTNFERLRAVASETCSS